MKSSFLRDIISLASSRVVVTILTVATSILTARYLGPEKNGIIAALTVYPLFFMSIGSMGIQQSATYFIGQNKFELKSVYSAIVVIWAFTTVFCTAVCFILIKYFSTGNYPLYLITLAIITIPFSLYTTYSSGIFLGQQNLKEYNKVSWIPAVMTFFLSVLLLVIFHIGIAGYLWATFTGAFILSILVFFKIRAIVSFDLIFDVQIIKQMLSLGLLYALEVLIFALNYRADIVLLEKMSTPFEIGIYSKGVNIVEILWQIPLFVGAVIFSRSAGATDKQAFSVKVCRLLRFASIAIIIASIALYLLSGIVINLMYGNAFALSVPVLRLLIPGVLLLTVLRILNMDLAGKGKPWLSMRAMIPAAIINIILNYILIPKYGANGSALASTISYSIATIIFIIVYSKEVNISLKEIFRPNKEDRAIVVAYYYTLRKKFNIK
ncbi:polysaccharide biosynthesis C-terminal domain-containing protein [Mucilaginibacter sp. dw_454]|uniref:oligosaccharide flippase family protein n=1 Tax=Mucilaginibacter sp. dw_454 TaxID=2720079 RepID=UPI001BD659A3|nr:polysaccharide biosynthesis C-terminal domain-containing protein [Mucilaginibacter sp. dw_454]